MIVTVLAWLIGFVAIHRKLKGQAVLERRQGAPSNGFGAWSERPAGGLKPPRITKSLVMSLGRTDSRRAAWEGWLAFTLLLAAFAALFAATPSNGVLLARISPSLAAPSIRISLIFGAGVLVIASCVRRWAVDCRKSLMIDAEAEVLS